MKKQKIIFLRHAETEKNPNLNAALWKLSEKGERQANEIASLKIMSEVDSIYTSKERKTILTVKPLAKKLNKDIKPLSFFNEVKRGDKFLTKKEFEKEKIKQLANLDYHGFDGESGREALSRFKQGIEKILKEEKSEKKILVVTHGTVLNIYFASLLNVYNKLPDRFKKTDFCAYGVIEDEVIIKDIV